MEITSKAIRIMFSEGDKKRDKGLMTPEDIFRYDNLLYGEDPVYQSLDIYKPKDALDQKLPTIVSVHGGGFVYGTKENYQYYCMNLAQRGFTVINFSYRLAPEYKFPAQLEDVNSVFHWLVDHAQTYNLDLENLFAVGDSAGGNLLGVYAGLLSKPFYNEKSGLDLDLPELKFKAVALNCGLYNPARQNPLKDLTLTANVMDALFEHKGKHEEMERINVENYISRSYPPTFIMTSDNDFLNEQPYYILEKLQKKEIPFILRYFASREIPLEHVFHLDIKLKESRICSDEECNFFREFINN